MVRNFDTGPGKLAPAYRGPYKIIKRLRNDRYVIEDIEGLQLSQRPYKGTWETANLKPWREKNNENCVAEYESEESQDDEEKRS